MEKRSFGGHWRRRPNDVSLLRLRLQHFAGDKVNQVAQVKPAFEKQDNQEHYVLKAATVVISSIARRG